MATNPIGASRGGGAATLFLVVSTIVHMEAMCLLSIIPVALLGVEVGVEIIT